MPHHARCSRSTWQAGRPRQRGATLLLGLIFLVLLTLHALASWTTNTVQMRVVGNLQVRQEAQAAANLALSRVLGNSGFVAATPTPVVLDLDSNGDALNDYRVVVQAACVAVTPLHGKDLDPAVPEDFQCLAGSSFGGASLCTLSHWNLRASVTAAPGALVSGAAVEVNQGATVRLERGEATDVC